MFRWTPVLQQSNRLFWKLFMVFTQVKWPVRPAGEHCQCCLLCGLSLANLIRPFLFFPQHYKQVKSWRGSLPHMCERVGSSSRFKTAFRNLSQNQSRGAVPGRKSGSFVLFLIRASLHTAEKHFTQLEKRLLDKSLNQVPIYFNPILKWKSNINPNNVSKGLRKVDSLPERFDCFERLI